MLKQHLSEKIWEFYEKHRLVANVTILMICMFGYAYDASQWLDAYARYLNNH